MTANINFRPAGQADCSDLAILSDAATRLLVSHMWSLGARVGQSWFEVGREAIRTRTGHFSHYSNWHVAELDGLTAGAVNGYVLPPVSAAAVAADVPPILVPLDALKGLAAGTWYISAASVFPEFRNRGVGEALIEKACVLARARNIDRVTLMVGSFNEGAQRLYLRSGFSEWSRRPYIPFPGSDPEGQWILMFKDL